MQQTEILGLTVRSSAQLSAASYLSSLVFAHVSVYKVDLFLLLVLVQVWFFDYIVVIL